MTDDFAVEDARELIAVQIGHANADLSGDLMEMLGRACDHIARIEERLAAAGSGPPHALSFAGQERQRVTRERLAEVEAERNEARADAERLAEALLAWLADVDDALEDDPGGHDAAVRIGTRWGDHDAKIREALAAREEERDADA